MFQRLSLVSRTSRLSLTASPAVRTFHQSATLASQRALELDRFRRSLGTDYAARKVPIKKLLEGLKGLQSERLLTNNNEKSAYYRDGYRDILQICHPGQTEVTIGQIEQVLTEENSVTWRAIKNLVSMGKIPELADLSPEKAAAVLFAGVYGIGPGKAKDLVRMGYRTLDDLINDVGKTVPKSSKMALANREDMEKPIPKEEMDIFKTLIAEALHKADPKIQFELMGMYRRGERLSLDIDIAVWHVSYVRADQERIAEDVMELVKNALVAAGLMGSERVFQSGKKKCMFLTRVPQSHAHLLSSDEEGQVATLRALEVRVCPVESVPYFLLANTGDDMLMKVIRKAAKSRQLVINEYGMGSKKVDTPNSTWWEEGTSIPASTEREIFGRLGVPYLEPTQRSFKHYQKIFSEHTFYRHMLSL